MGNSPMAIDAAGDVTAHGDGVLKSLDGQWRLHPRVDRVPDDPVAERVLDRAEVETFFRGQPPGM